MSARILIVDDEEIVIRSCRRILSDSQLYAVDSTQDGADALRRVDESEYDLLVLDIMMPGIDGLEVLQQVKERHPDVDVIMVTGLSQIQTAVKAMKLGAFDYLLKPIRIEKLIERIGDALKKVSN